MNISSVTAAAPTTHASPAPSPKPSQQPPSSPVADSVHLSQTALAAAALMKEAVETAGQTAQEAGHGDLQAQRLLAKEAVARTSNE